MKKIRKIVSLLVATYLLIIPAFLAVHAYEHYVKDDLAHGFELSVSNGKDTCVLHQAYHGQSSVRIDHSFSTSLHSFSFTFITIEEAPLVDLDKLVSLRGPPAV